ncbi:trimethylamine-N-oxide reductase TorA, partial [Salmonella enterica subsp. enterica serovar Montevideo]|nr:trimethylamine-N-oxide reductase TorA [Salmonella enterica subsp. enterica serovar Montevideo]
HNASGMLARAIALHGNSVSTGGDYSTGAAQVILPRVVGSMEVSRQTSQYRSTLTQYINNYLTKWVPLYIEKIKTHAQTTTLYTVA